MFNFYQFLRVTLVGIIIITGCSEDESPLESQILFYKNCFDSGLSLPTSQLVSNYKLHGNFDGRSFAIGNGAEGFTFSLQYVTTFITDENSTSNPSSEVQKFIELVFDSNNNDLAIGLRIPITQSQYNSSIQNLLHDVNAIELSTNLDFQNPSVVVWKNCEDKVLELSSTFSSKESQSMIVDHFNFFPRNDSIHYSLSCHGMNLEIASIQFNDFDNPQVKDLRGEFNPVYNLTIDSLIIGFALPE